MGGGGAKRDGPSHTDDLSGGIADTYSPHCVQRESGSERGSHRGAPVQGAVEHQLAYTGGSANIWAHVGSDVVASIEDRRVGCPGNRAARPVARSCPSRIGQRLATPININLRGQNAGRHRECNSGENSRPKAGGLRCIILDCDRTESGRGRPPCHLCRTIHRCTFDLCYLSPSTPGVSKKTANHPAQRKLPPPVGTERNLGPIRWRCWAHWLRGNTIGANTPWRQ